MTQPISPDDFPLELVDQVQFQVQEEVNGHPRGLHRATADLGFVLKQAALWRVQGREVRVFSAFAGQVQ